MVGPCALAQMGHRRGRAGALVSLAAAWSVPGPGRLGLSRIPALEQDVVLAPDQREPIGLRPQLPVTGDAEALDRLVGGVRLGSLQQLAQLQLDGGDEQVVRLVLEDLGYLVPGGCPLDRFAAVAARFLIAPRITPPLIKSSSPFFHHNLLKDSRLKKP